MTKIERIIWKGAFNILKLVAKPCIWIVRRRGNSFNMWKLGRALESTYLDPNIPSKISPMFSWFFNAGWDLMGEAAKNEFENIKTLYNYDGDWNPDETPYQMIEDYFEN